MQNIKKSRFQTEADELLKSIEQERIRAKRENAKAEKEAEKNQPKSSKKGTYSSGSGGRICRIWSKSSLKSQISNSTYSKSHLKYNRNNGIKQQSVIYKLSKGGRYKSQESVKNGLYYIAGISQNAKDKNEDVEILYHNRYGTISTKNEEEKTQYIANFYNGISLEINIPTQKDIEENNRKYDDVAQHHIFSLKSNTTLNGKAISREKLMELEVIAIQKTLEESPILRNRNYILAKHQDQKKSDISNDDEANTDKTNRVHCHIIFSSYDHNGEKTLGYTKRQDQEQIRRAFAENCRSMGLDVEIPKEKEKQPYIDFSTQWQTIVAIHKNDRDEVISFETMLENGKIIKHSDQDIKRFFKQNSLNIDDKIKFEKVKTQETNIIGKIYTKNKLKLLNLDKNQNKEKKDERSRNINFETRKSIIARRKSSTEAIYRELEKRNSREREQNIKSREKSSGHTLDISKSREIFESMENTRDRINNIGVGSISRRNTQIKEIIAGTTKFLDIRREFVGTKFTNTRDKKDIRTNLNPTPTKERKKEEKDKSIER